MRLSQAACAAMLSNPWVGNVRQLQNVIFRAVTMTERNIIQVEDLELAQVTTPAAGDGTEVGSLDEAVAEFEKNLLQRLYREHPSSRRLARRLGTSHTAIANRLRRYGIA
jgi:transcriptional regulator of aroF, aroG, tyrA and aromatic amino acid transport